MSSSRILFLSKRRYMGKDLLADRFGRFYELPRELARLGHKVTGICLDYRSPRHGLFEEDGVIWHSFGLGGTKLPDLIAYARASFAIAREFAPATVVSASDAFHAIWGHRLARRIGAASVIDLYDNFESYRGTGWPGIRQAFAASIRDADAVSCISQPLKVLVEDSYGRSGPTTVLENGTDRALFRPMDKNSARAALGLPRDAEIYGVAGALARSRDIETLFRAAELIASRRRGAILALAGPRDSGLAWPRGDGWRDFGALAHDEVPRFLNALDLVVVPLTASPFGNFCYPQKAVEASACGKPFVTARTGALAQILSDRPGILYEPGNAEALAETIEANLERTEAVLEVADWSQIASRLSQLIGTAQRAPA